MILRPLQDKIILADILFGIAVVGKWLGFIEVPIVVAILLAILIIVLEIASIAMRNSWIDAIASGLLNSIEGKE